MSSTHHPCREPSDGRDLGHVRGVDGLTAVAASRSTVVRDDDITDAPRTRGIGRGQRSERPGPQ